MRSAFVFAGQGSQYVGMGKSLAAASVTARAVFEEVDDALRQKLSALMFDGPEAELQLTKNAQPAIMALSIAALRVLEVESGIRLADKASFVAGHSLGEYSALCAAGALSLADTARLLKARGLAMQAAVPVGIGAMAALLGATLEQAQSAVNLAAEGEVCTVANDNAPGQVVISGHKHAVERAVVVAKDLGIKRGIMLAVSAPFHCPLMQPAADAMALALADLALSAPFVPLVANVTAAPVTDPDTIRKLLVDQVTAMVRWRESVRAMAELDVDHFAEFGGKVVGPMIKRIVPDAKVDYAVDMPGIEELAKGF